jgi:hypothetical protein
MLYTQQLVASHRFRFLRTLGVLGFCLLLLAPVVHAQSVRGLQAPEKTAATIEPPVQVKAARGEAPLSRLYDYLKVEPAKIKQLPALSEREKRTDLSEKILRIGVVRPFDRALNPLSDGPLYRLSDGNAGDVRVLGIVSTGALYTRVHFSGMSLPPGARVFVYSLKNPDDFYGPYEGRGLSPDGTFWTPPMKGDAIAVEYFTPPGANIAFTPFTVDEISHNFKDIFATDDAGACNLEVTAPWANLAKSVGALEFVTGGGVGLCTGTLLNDQASDQTPYLLTANHCFSSQTEAQSLRVYWNYNTGADPPPGTPFTDGATLLATGTSSDFTFVRLTGSLPGGLFFSGWDAATTPVSTSVTGIHHPAGSHKRISFGTTNSNCLGGLPGPCSNFTHVGWSSGVTEGGSSGSGIWKGSSANALFVGTLTGGLSSCADPNGNDEYGSFSATYPNIAAFLSGADCVASVSPASQNVSANPSSGSVTVTAPGGCGWTANSTASFITITSGASGNGNGTVNFNVSSNNGALRSGTIVVGQKVATITQAAGGSCTPIPINLGQTVNGSLTTGSCPLGDGSFYQPYSFDGVAGQQISIFMSASFDTYLFLMRPDGSLFLQDDDGGGGTNSRIPAGSGLVSLPTTGTYVIKANSFDPGVTGSFSLTFNGQPPPQPTVRVSASSYQVSEGSADVIVTILRTGNTAGMTTVDYATSDTAGANNCNFNNGVASSRCDYLTTIGTVTFAAGESNKNIMIPVIDDTYADGSESFTFALSNVGGGTLGAPSSATLTINDNDAGNAPNPIDISSFFVRQHYVDFLNREPDANGLNFWVGEIENCTPKPQCTEIKRINVSAAFFLSIEFQETGYLVYRTYKAAYGNLAGAPVPLRFNEFLPDTQQIGAGVQVGVGNWQVILENNKVAYMLGFVGRSRFTTAYPTTLSPAQFVDALFANAGVTPSTVDRDAAINEFGGAGNTSDTGARGRALRRVAENSILRQQESNRAFVLMQYFGYLRRNPNDAPEQNLNFDGYNFWLGKLNQFNGNFVDAEMVKAFIVASEYRQRFGP